ncbi:hypothetical protein [Legionella clemsonensis]|nr:hypothetical protein [Legionella clemsonensis]
MKKEEFKFLQPKNYELTGDELKRQILKDIKLEIEDTYDKQSFRELYAKIKNSPEYRIITTGQGMATKILGLETDSHKTLMTMIKTRAEDFGIDNLDKQMERPLESPSLK